MPKRKQDVESTPIPVDMAFALGESLTGRLQGNAFSGEAKLTIFYSTDEDAGHLTITSYGALQSLLGALQQFCAEMANKGRSH